MTTHLRTQQQQQSHTPTRNIHVMTNAIIMTYNRLQSIEEKERERRGGRERKERGGEGERERRGGRERKKEGRERGGEGGSEEGGRERGERGGNEEGGCREISTIHYITDDVFLSPPSLSPSILSLSLSHRNSTVSSLS